MIKAARLAFVCLALAACSHQTTSDEPHVVATIVTDTLVAEVNESPTPEMLVGRWGDNGDCTKDIVINADGAFRSYTGSAGRWTLEGNILTMSGDAGTVQLRVATAGENTLIIGQPDGSFGTSQRCPPPQL
jgi:hypothetical protein